MDVLLTQVHVVCDGEEREGEKEKGGRTNESRGPFMYSAQSRYRTGVHFLLFLFFIFGVARIARSIVPPKGLIRRTGVPIEAKDNQKRDTHVTHVTHT